MDGVLAVVGTGRMGEAVLGGLLGAGVLTPEQVVCADPVRPRREEVHRRYGVEVTADTASAIDGADVVLVAVKPQVLGDLLRREAASFTAEQTVLSIVAGVPTSTFEAALPEGIAVVRVMPNTPAQIGAGVSALCAGRHASEADLAIAEDVFSAVGSVLRVPEEQLDAVTAISGSGPAYVFLFAEALIDAGVLLGLGRPEATELAVGTLLGSARLLAESDEGPTALKEAVTSPGGTTIAALRELERGGLRAAVFDATQASARRAGELADPA